ncbi:bifunctional 2-polyprenyl-6-hydroxyphenol methylase/3-demethylubiquinol 3-O-methyltransferase UbiG [Paenibacillus sp. NEAU-GSW1]|uniref:class I SAM-dependent methyltransferase n=1 Tax=Paenibacillus sp. NEAU-GSW1 TaxID=2682486 RepID=UPI0012E24BA0|nr:class I SAM-dependent methyltransferase [Paenibacillus sp. NEAU-GSW1]MUT68435.1 methyltransferase domain-containing protein [Paenibacillus sp. NEAU-GSW1]
MTAKMTAVFDEMLQLTTELFFEQELKLFFRFPEWEQPPANVIDVGCGNGAYLSRLHQVYPELPMTGLEIENSIFEFAKAKCNEGLEFHLSSYEKSSFKTQSVAAIVARLVMPHINDRLHFAEWANAQTAAGSRLIVLDVDSDELQWNERLPLFSQLYVQSRQSILRKSWLTFPSILRVEMEKGGFRHLRTVPYRLAADTYATKLKLYRYMQCAAELYKGAPPSAELEEELSAWLRDESASHEIHMFGIEFEKR